MSKPIADLLGLAGFLPIYPKSYFRAWTNRKLIKENFAKENMSQENTIWKLKSGFNIYIIDTKFVYISQFINKVIIK